MYLEGQPLVSESMKRVEAKNREGGEERDQETAQKQRLGDQ